MPLRPFPKGVQEASRSPRHIEPLPIWVTWNVPSPWKVGSRMDRSIMSWLKWILAYLFDCVHPHTTWPHQDRAGLAYVCCVDCGRELPYSVQQMKIVTRQEQLQDLPQTVGTNPRGTPNL